MKNVLQLHSSLFAENSASVQISDQVVTKIREKYHVNQLVTRNLAEQQVPHLDGVWFRALNAPAAERTEEQQAMADFSDELIHEIQAADIVVIGAPMYNFSVPSVLKAWFDHITRAGVTFRYSENGPQGLLQNKTAFVVTTRGGLHKHASTDALVPFMKTILGFVGIDDVRIIYAEGLNMGNGQRQKGLTEARESIAQLVA